MPIVSAKPTYPEIDEHKFSSALFINDAKIEDVIIREVNLSTGLEASTVTFILPRRYDDYGGTTLENNVKVHINGRLVFNGAIRNKLPKLSTEEEVAFDAVDYSVRFNDNIFQKDGETRVVYNEGNRGSKTVREILNDIMASGLVSDLNLAVQGPDFYPGEVIFDNMPCGECFDSVLKRAGNYKWWVTPNKQIMIRQMGTGPVRSLHLGQKGRPAREGQIVQNDLQFSDSGVVNRIIFTGGRRQYEIMEELECLDATPYNYPTPCTLVEEGECICHRYNFHYKSTHKDWMPKLLDDGDIIVEKKVQYHQWITTSTWPMPRGYYKFWWEWQPADGYEIDYDKGEINFSNPQIGRSEKKWYRPWGATEYVWAEYHYTHPVRAKYVYKGDVLKIDTGKQGNAPITVTRGMADEKMIQQFNEHGMVRDDSPKMTELALKEIEPTKDIRISGTATVKGDEYAELLGRVNITGAVGSQAGEYGSLNASVIRVSHKLEDRFTTTLELSNEVPRLGVPPEAEQDRKKEVSKEIKGAKKRIEVLEEKVKKKASISSGGAMPTELAEIKQQLEELKKKVYELEKEPTLPSHSHLTEEEGGPCFASKGANYV